MVMKNRIVEIKSTWTYETNEEKCLAKREGAINMGFLYDIIIITNKGVVSYL